MTDIPLSALCMGSVLKVLVFYSYLLDDRLEIAVQGVAHKKVIC